MVLYFHSEWYPGGCLRKCPHPRLLAAWDPEWLDPARPEWDCSTPAPHLLVKLPANLFAEIIVIDSRFGRYAQIGKCLENEWRNDYCPVSCSPEPRGFRDKEWPHTLGSFFSVFRCNGSHQFIEGFTLDHLVLQKLFRPGIEQHTPVS